MNGLWIVLEVVGLFFLRIGVPLLILIVVGIVLDRWQSRRTEAWRQAPPKPPHDEPAQRAIAYPPTWHHVDDRSRP